MNFFDKFQRGLEKVVGPFATAVANSRYIKALTEGFMYTMPITLGVAAIAVLANLPIPAWTQFFTEYWNLCDCIRSCFFNFIFISYLCSRSYWICFY